MSEYAPGTVAVVEAGCWANRKIALRLAEGWSHVNGVSLDSDGIVTPIRPLVVIDPEDREQVERLDSTIAETVNRYAAGHCGGVDALRSALREFAKPTPPKPPEPKGLGAVVEDRDGVQYVRIQTDYSHPWVRRGVAGQVYGWHEFAAVRVLSEGVQ